MNLPGEFANELGGGSRRVGQLESAWAQMKWNEMGRAGMRFNPSHRSRAAKPRLHHDAQLGGRARPVSARPAAPTVSFAFCRPRCTKFPSYQLADLRPAWPPFWRRWQAAQAIDGAAVSSMALASLRNPPGTGATGMLISLGRANAQSCQIFARLRAQVEVRKHKRARACIYTSHHLRAPPARPRRAAQIFSFFAKILERARRTRPILSGFES